MRAGPAQRRGAHRPRALLRALLQQEAPALHHLAVRQLEGPQDLRQPQGALVLDAVVGQGQPEQGAVQPQALGDVARALVPDEVEAQVERDQRPVAAVQRGQSAAQELRPVVVDVVVPQGQVRDPGRREGTEGPGVLGVLGTSGDKATWGGPWGLRRRGRRRGSLGRSLRSKEGRGLAVPGGGRAQSGGGDRGLTGCPVP